MKPRYAVALIALLAVAAKLYCAATTFGSRDVQTFYQFGQAIEAAGLVFLYKSVPLFNHTPLVGEYTALAYRWAGHGEEVRVFAFLIRLPAILADLCATGALLWLREKTARPSYWALGLFAASPAAFAISGYHGNFDSVVALGVLLAGMACVLERPGLCGCFLGLACNIKIIPVMLAPVFAFHWLQQGRAWRFAAPAAGIALAGWALPLYQVPLLFLKNVFAYSSVWGLWGITCLFRLSGAPDLQVLSYGGKTPAQQAIALVLKVIVIASVLWLAWTRRRVRSAEIFKVLGLAWAVFFVFAPGFAPQYLVWPAACLLMASERWFAAFLVASSVSALVFYSLISQQFPWLVGFAVESTAKEWSLWLLPSWGVLAAYLVVEWRSCLGVGVHVQPVEAKPAAASAG